jgi:hypothetical protein
MEIVSLLQSLQAELPPAEREAQKLRLEHQINYLVHHDFSRLVQLLYTVDVDEQKLKSILLQQPCRDAAQIITELLITRQEEKMQSRQQHGLIHEFDDEEQW